MNLHLQHWFHEHWPHDPPLRERTRHLLHDDRFWIVIALVALLALMVALGRQGLGEYSMEPTYYTPYFMW